MSQKQGAKNPAELHRKDRYCKCRIRRRLKVAGVDSLLLTLRS